MLEKSLRSQTIAMAAVCQSALLIQNIAKGRSADAGSLECLLSGIMVTSPSSVHDVFGSLDDISEGGKLMVHQLSGQATGKDVELTRYIAGILALAKRLLNKASSLNSLKQALDDIERRLEHFDLTSSTIIHSFADCYSTVISPIGQKIQVIGSPNVLQQQDVQNKVRALLLAGVRAAVLWRQLGGKRRHFVFNRQKILQDAILFNKEITAIS